MFSYLTSVVVLLLNMLIAMMSKTFDLITETATLQFQYVLSQAILSLAGQDLTMAPLSLASLPFDLIAMSFRIAKKCRPQLRAPGWILLEEEAEEVTGPANTPTGTQATPKVDFDARVKQMFAKSSGCESVSALKKSLEEFEVDHMNDEVQTERRWTQLQKKLAELQKQLDGAMKKQDAATKQQDTATKELKQLIMSMAPNQGMQLQAVDVQLATSQ
jgi:hypothetical protein